MTKYESYAARHAKQEPRASTPNPYSATKSKSIFLHQNLPLLDEINGKASKVELALYNERLLQLQHKMTNLTNIVKLVQRYTETQDIQYQKEKRMAVGRESMLNGLISDHEGMMRRQEDYLMEIQQTQRRIREESVQEMVEGVGERIRREMNMKIQILVNEIKDSRGAGNNSNSSFQRMEMDQTRERLLRLENNMLKGVSKKEFSKFKGDVNEEMENIVERFTKMMKKYMSTSAGTPTKSPDNESEKMTLNTYTLQKKDRAEKQKRQDVVEKGVGQEKHTVRLFNSNERVPKILRNESQENIHPNILKGKSPTSRSRTKSKEKSLSKKKQIVIEKPVSTSPKPKIADKRKEKEAQLRQIIKHSKDKKALR